MNGHGLLQWFDASWRWLLIIGALLSIVGLIYSTCGVIGKNIPNRITQGFAFGVIGGLIGVVIYFIALLFFFCLSLKTSIKQSEFVHFLNAYFDLSDALSFGIITGVLLGIFSKPMHKVGASIKGGAHSRKITKKVDWLRNSFLFGVAFLLFIFFASYFSQNPTSDQSTNFLLASIICGFIVGFIYDKTKYKWRNYVILYTCLFLLILLLFLLSKNNDFATYAFIFYYVTFLNTFILGYLQGAIFNQSRISDQSLKEGTWRSFFTLFGLGLICGIVFSFLATILLQEVVITQFAATIGLLIAFGKGDGNRLIQQLRPQIKFDRGKIQLPINWERFVRAFLIASINSLMYTFFFMFITIISGNLSFLPLYSEFIQVFGVNWYVVLLTVTSIFSACLFGLFAGTLYCFGPLLAYLIDKIAEKRLVIIGLILGSLGIVALVIPPVFG